MRIVTIFGGTGFLGRHIVQRLAQEGYGIRVATRRPELAGFLRPCGDVGQIVPVQANVRNEESVRRAVAGADAVINLTGILYERGRQNFYAVHVASADRIARAAAEAGAAHLLHVSAIGADAASPSEYAQSKAAGEAAVRQAFPKATVFRPSLVFGPEDDFFNRFASMVRLVPVLPLFFDGLPKMKLDGLFLTPEFEAGTTRFQPVFVGDIAEATQRVLGDDAAQGKTFELGGPSIYSYAELMALVAQETGRKALFAPVPFFAAGVMATLLQFAPVPPLTPDQVKLLRIDNVVAPDALALADLGVEATAAELILPTYLRDYRRGNTESAPVGGT
ncbi:MAG: complex I NDUFA9 subunit family protein [Rhodospirillaceae bacterium]|nr:complex I NDUFA9 subunit family protein [Rhodospirillaceae bacterium]